MPCISSLYLHMPFLRQASQWTQVVKLRSQSTTVFTSAPLLAAPFISSASSISVLPPRLGLPAIPRTFNLPLPLRLILSNHHSIALELLSNSPREDTLLLRLNYFTLPVS